jgi:phage replication O-like protein O
MANPQKENGYTAIANEIIEHLCMIKLTDYESRILHTLWRKTYGWNKKSDVISLSQWSTATNISIHHIPRTLQLLEHRNLIIINRLQPKIIQYQFQKNFETWDKSSELDDDFKEQIKDAKSQVVPNEVVPNEVVPNEVVPNEVVPNEDFGSTQRGTQVVPNEVDTITILQKQYTKTNITKAIDLFVLPDWVDVNIWDSFLEMRRKKKAIPTEHAKDLIIKELMKLRDSGNEPNAVLEQSTLNNYTDVYPLKNKGVRNNGHRSLKDEIENGKVTEGNLFAEHSN